MIKKLYILLFYVKHPLICLKNLKSNIGQKKVSSYKTLDKNKVSIIIVTFNALDYVKVCLKSLQKTRYKNYEVIAVDNNSDSETKKYLQQVKKEMLIDKLYLSSENTYFTGGNNIGASLSSENSKYLLFLNSDVEIKNPNWLNILMANKPKKGVISFGKVDIPVIRPDGWCFMVEKNIFQELGGLNEYYKMNWSITEFTAKILKAGYSVKSITNPNEYVYHFGQKSRPKKKKQVFKEMTMSQVINSFKGTKVSLLKI